VANLVERGDPARVDAAVHLPHQVGHKRVQHAANGFADGEARPGVRMLCDRYVVAASEERDGLPHLFEMKNSGVEAVIEIGGEVGDFIGKVDELRLDGRKLVEEVCGELRMLGGCVVARVLDDAFADTQREVQAAKRGVAFFEPGDDAQRVQVVIEAEAVSPEGAVQRLFSGVAKWRMADVVDQRQRFGERHIQAKGRRQGARDLRDFERMRQAAAEMIGGAVAWQVREDLRFSGETAKGPGMQDARSVACEGSAVGVREFAVGPLRQRSVVPYRNAGRQQIRRLGVAGHLALRVTSGYTASGRSDAREGLAFDPAKIRARSH
jgi:hypothetical protein